MAERSHDAGFLIQIIQQSRLAAVDLVAADLTVVRVAAVRGLTHGRVQQLDGNGRFPPLPKKHTPKGTFANLARKLELVVCDLPCCCVQSSHALYRSVRLRAAAGVA